MWLHNQRGATPNKPSHTEIHTLSPKKGFGATTDQKPGPDPQQACNQATKLADAKPIPAKENMSTKKPTHQPTRQLGRVYGISPVRESKQSYTALQRDPRKGYRVYPDYITGSRDAFNPLLSRASRTK